MSPMHDLAGPPRPQVCGRCRDDFAGDTGLPQDRDTGWWACPDCRLVLFGEAVPDAAPSTSST
jgi:hypothetical protein